MGVGRKDNCINYQDNHLLARFLWYQHTYPCLGFRRGYGHEGDIQPENLNISDAFLGNLC